MKTISVALPLLMAGVSASPWRGDDPIPIRRADRTTDSLDACPVITRITVELTPVCYSRVFSSTAVIDPFGNGEYLTISRVPTTVIRTSTRTSLIAASTAQSNSGWDVVSTQSVGIGFQPIPPTLPIETMLGGLISEDNQVAGNVGPHGVGPNNADPNSVQPTNNAQSTNLSDSVGNIIPTSESDIAPGASTRSEPPAVPTASGAVTLTSATSGELGLGQGLPSGSFTDLPDDQFIFLAVSASSTNPLVPTAVPQAIAQDPPGAALIRRQQQEPVVERRPLRLVDLESKDDASENVSQDQCDSADPLLLRNGRLLQYDYSIGKALGESLAPLGFLIPPPANQVDRTFSLTNGVLQWNATDVGNALFFSCNGEIVAAFEEMVPAGCMQVIMGAIDGDACRKRVEKTRSPIDVFTAPLGENPTSSVPVSVTWTPPVPVSTPSTNSSGTGTSSMAMPPNWNSTIVTSGPFTTGSLMPTTSISNGSEMLSDTASPTSTCESPLQTQNNAINSRMAEALRTGNPDLVTESELLRQIPVSVDGRRSIAFSILPNDTTVTWLLNPNTGFVRNPGGLDSLLRGNLNTVENSTPANKTLAAIGTVPGFDARVAYFGGNPFMTDDAGTASRRPVSDEGMTAVIKNTVGFLVQVDTCNTDAASTPALKARQAAGAADLRIVLAQARDGSQEQVTLASLQSLFPEAVINGGSKEQNACDFVPGQSNPCIADANLLILGDDGSVGNEAIAQQVIDLHRAGLALLVMGENGNPRPLSQKVMARLGVTVAQNYFNGRAVIDQATKEDLIPSPVVSDQVSTDSLTIVRYLRDDPLVVSDYSSCLSTTYSGVGDSQLKGCIESPGSGISGHAKPYFAALSRFRQLFDGLSAVGTDLFEVSFGSQTELIRVLALLSDKYRRGRGNQSGDTVKAISYPVDLRQDGVAAGKSFYADWLTPRTTKATGRPQSLGSLYCPTRDMAEQDIESCQSPSFPNVGDYPLTVRSAPEDRFTATGFDQIPGRPSIVTLRSDPGFPVYIRFTAGSDDSSRATLLSRDAVSTYNRPSYAGGPAIRLMPNIPLTLNTPYGGPLYVRMDATSSDEPRNIELAFENVARHPILNYPATSAEVAAFAAELSTSNAYWADIVDDVFEVHFPIAKQRSGMNSPGLYVGADPRRLSYNTTNAVAELIEDFRSGWAGQIYKLAGLKVRSESLTSTLSADDRKICVDLGLPCLNETINTRISHQHITYDSYAACGGLCSGNPITTGGDIKPVGWGEGHELGHNLQRVQLGIFWPDTNLGAEMGKIDSWTNYVRRDGEVSNNIFPNNNVYTYFRFTLPARSNDPPYNGRMSNDEEGKDVDTFSAYASANSNLRANGKQVVLNAKCNALGSYPIGTRSDVMLADAIWSDGAYSANAGTRLTFYVPLPDLLQGRTMSNGVKLTDGRDIFTLLYQAARAFSTYAADEQTWVANRASLGLSMYNYQNDVVYGPGKTVNAMIGNDFMLVLLCRITGYDFRPYFASRGVFYTASADRQVEANAASGSALRKFGKLFLALNTQHPQVNRTAVLPGSPSAYKSNDVYFDASDPATRFPGSDDDRDGTPENFLNFHPRSCAGITAG